MATEGAPSPRARRLAEELAVELLGPNAHGAIEFPVVNGRVRYVHRKGTVLLIEADRDEQQAADAARELLPGIDEIGGVDGPKRSA